MTASLLGDMVAAQMQKALGLAPAKPVVKRASTVVPTSCQDVIYTLSLASQELEDLGLINSSVQVIGALESIALELEDFGLTSKEEDNFDEALERNPEIYHDLKDELEQDPDIVSLEGEEEPLEDLGLEEAEDRLLDLISQTDQDDKLEQLIQEWHNERELDLAMAEMDKALSKYAYSTQGSDDPLDVDLDLSMTLQELIAEDDLDSHLVDTFNAEDWEDE